VQYHCGGVENSWWDVFIHHKKTVGDAALDEVTLLKDLALLPSQAEEQAQFDLLHFPAPTTMPVWAWSNPVTRQRLIHFVAKFTFLQQTRSGRKPSPAGCLLSWPLCRHHQSHHLRLPPLRGSIHPSVGGRRPSAHLRLRGQRTNLVFFSRKAEALKGRNSICAQKGATFRVLGFFRAPRIFFFRVIVLGVIFVCPFSVSSSACVGCAGVTCHLSHRSLVLRAHRIRSPGQVPHQTTRYGLWRMNKCASAHHQMAGWIW